MPRTPGAADLIRQAREARAAAREATKQAAAAVKAARLAREQAARAEAKLAAAAYRDTEEYLARLTPAYRSRIERARAKGKTRQQARGHKAREHVERRAREAREAAQGGKITSSQRQAMKRFVIAQAAKAADYREDEDEAWSDWKDFFEAKGYAWFLDLRAAQRSLQRQGRGALGGFRGSGKNSPGMRELERLASRREAESWMMFYH